MHAHNQFSNWYGHLLAAAEQLGIPVGLRHYANHDGSTDREYYVLASALARVGMPAIEDLAWRIAVHYNRGH